MNYFRYLNRILLLRISIIILVSVFSASCAERKSGSTGLIKFDHSGGGGMDSGGGNGYASDFIHRLNLQADQILRLDSECTSELRVDAEKIRESLSLINVETTDDDLMVDGSIVDAINFPSKLLIKLNTKAWNSYVEVQQERLMDQLALHELLSVTGHSDQNYNLSRTLSALFQEPNCLRFVTATQSIPIEIDIKWSSQGAIPRPRTETSGIVMGDDFYFIGGRSSIPLKIADKFNFKTREWTALAPMESSRVAPLLLTHQKNLYAIGGEYLSPINQDISDIEAKGISAEKYNTTSDQWTKLPSIELSDKFIENLYNLQLNNLLDFRDSSFLSINSVQTSEKFLTIAVGISGSPPYTECFDLAENKWVPSRYCIEDSPAQRQVEFLKVENKEYALGINSILSDYLSVSLYQNYSQNSGGWVQTPAPLKPVSHARGLVNGDLIMLFGGTNPIESHLTTFQDSSEIDGLENTVKSQTVSTVQAYDTKESQWLMATPFKMPRKRPNAIIYDNNIYLFGGEGDSGEPIRTFEMGKIISD